MKQVLVITGASKGIGHATAARFAQNGWDVINLSRSACDVPGVTNMAVDLTAPAWSQEYGEELQALVGTPQRLSLVHNAAVMTKETAQTLTPVILRRVLELNVVAPAELNRLLIPHMLADSSIIYISSTLGRKAVANTHAYVVSKHAVIGQMRATCQDLAGTMIHTAAICPGFTETEMLREHLGAHPEVLAQITSGIAHRRLVQPAEIAETIWFVAQNPVLNGTVLDANLGQIET